MIFGAVNETSRTFLTSVAPAQRTWLAEECTAFVVIRKLVGTNYHSGLRALADQVGASDLFSDEDAGRLSATCLPVDVGRVREGLEAEINAVRRTTLAEIWEECMLNKVRACFGAGGQVDCVLFPGQFISLNLSNLAPATTAGDLFALAARFGHVRDAVVVSRPAGDGVGETAYGRLLFASPDTAAAALAGLNHEVILGREIVVRPGGAFVPKASTAVQQCKVVLSWSLAPSTGRCLVQFSSVQDYQTALMKLRQRGLCVGPFIFKGNKNVGRASEGGAVADPTTLKISGLSNSADEDDVKALLANLGCWRPISVSIERKVQVANEAAEVCPISVILEEVLSLVPLLERIVSLTSFFAAKNTRAGLTIDFWLEVDIDEVMRQWTKRERCLRQGLNASAADDLRLNGQKIRLRAEHLMHMSLDEGLYAHFKARLVELGERVRRDFQVETRVNVVRGKAMVNWCSPCRRALNLSVRQFETVVASTPYNPGAGKHLLFTKAGRIRMERATDDDVYILWDVRR